MSHRKIQLVRFAPGRKRKRFIIGATSKWLAYQRDMAMHWWQDDRTFIN